MKYKVGLILSLAAAMLLLAIAPLAAQDEFLFGMVLVGPKNDRGWSQANYEAGQYIEDHIAGARMLPFESLNQADSPEATLLSVVTEMVDEGAKLIFTTSDAFEEDTTAVAAQFPDVVFINTSGSAALTGDAPSNLGNIMGQMIWGKEIAGCAAGLTTKTGSVGYLGPLINWETRRLANSAYLGARYCYEHYAGGNPDDLTFTVTWIGFWFNIPGVTLDPTEEVNRFYDNGADVVLSGIDTTEALTVASQRKDAGEDVAAVAYDFANACDQAPDVCLGVPYFNWGPAYLATAQKVIDGTWAQDWEWNAPDWTDINNLDTSAVGFTEGPALTDEAKTNLEDFIAAQAAFAQDNESFFLYEGPINYQDGTEFVPADKYADPIDVWYTAQLLEGMVGASE